jgi:hypothetical protein
MHFFMRLGLRENLQETTIFQGKSWFLMFAVDFSLGRSEDFYRLQIKARYAGIVVAIFEVSQLWPFDLL